MGIGQMGKSFRNEVSVSNFIFRTREFEQMELQYFCSPQESQQHFRYWVDYAEQWLTQRAGVRPENVRRKEYEAKELAHYALATVDLEYRYPFGWEELWGVANRGDYDLKMHQQSSGVSMMYSDPAGGKVRGGGQREGRQGKQRVCSQWYTHSPRQGISIFYLASHICFCLVTSPSPSFSAALLAPRH